MAVHPMKDPDSEEVETKEVKHRWGGFYHNVAYGLYSRRIKNGWKLGELSLIQNHIFPPGKKMKIN